MRVILLVLLLVAAVSSAKRGRGKTGFRRKSNLQNRIVGGSPVDIADYGWQVSLQYLGGHFCGGSILNEHWILSAGHCFGSNTSPLFTKVRAGSNLTTSGGELTYVDEIIVHPDFNQTSLDNDASLVRVFPPLRLDGVSIRAANVVEKQKETPSGTLVTVTGWGTLKQGGTSSPTLQGVTVPVIDRTECEESYAQLSGLTDTMMCAGLQEGGKDSCQGDSGGPLVDTNKVLVGIVSWGIGCAKADSPGVYTEIAVPKIRDFIAKYTNV